MVWYVPVVVCGGYTCGQIDWDIGILRRKVSAGRGGLETGTHDIWCLGVLPMWMSSTLVMTGESGTRHPHIQKRPGWPAFICCGRWEEA